MNCTTKSNTHILDYLDQNGHQPIKTKHGSSWYLSPLRNETTPSFKVDLNKNLWYDFGTGEGGNLIDLIVKFTNSTVPEALDHLRHNSYNISAIADVPDNGSGHIRIDHLQTLSNPALINYLKSRGVSYAVGKAYLKEAYYTVHGKQYFALAFENDKRGYELRNAYFKTGSSPKHFTTIPGTDNSRLNVFEGFMDFLSCCTYHLRRPKNRTIVLNSLSFLPRIEPELVQASEIYLYLDNDEAGRKATQQILSSYVQVEDRSQSIYPDYKDFNDFLMNRRIQ